MPQSDQTTVTIASGQSLSPAFEVPFGYRIVGIRLPATWSTASLLFHPSTDGVTYEPQQDASGNLVEIKVATGKLTGVTEYDLPLFNLTKVQSVQNGAPATPIAQGGDRVIIFLIRPER